MALASGATIASDRNRMLIKYTTKYLSRAVGEALRPATLPGNLNSKGALRKRRGPLRTKGTALRTPEGFFIALRSPAPRQTTIGLSSAFFGIPHARYVRASVPNPKTRGGRGNQSAVEIKFISEVCVAEFTGNIFRLWETPRWAGL